MKKLKKLISITLTAALLTVGLAGCGNSNENSATEGTAEKESVAAEATTEEVSTEDSSTELKPFILGVAGSDDNYSAEIANLAIKSGYLDEELEAVGYQLQLVSFSGSGPAINEAIAGGSVNGGVYGDLPILTANANGIGLTIIGSVNNSLQFGILAGPNVSFDSPKDLEGKRVVVLIGSILQYAWDAYVKENDIDVSSIELINTSDISSLLTTGEADFVISTIGSLKYMESLGLGTLVDDTQNISNPSGQFVAIENAYLKENPDVAVAFNKAIIRAYEEAVVNPDAFYESVKTSTYTTDIIKTVYAADETLANLSPELSDAVVSNVQAVIDWMVENSLIFTEIKASEITDNSYYEQALSNLSK